MWKVIIYSQIFIFFLSPLNTAASKSSEQMKKEMDTNHQNIGSVARNEENIGKRKPNVIRAKVPDENQITETLCREDSGVSVNNKSLICYYKCGPDQYLRLAPFKAEQLHLNPDVLMVHDMISDEEAGFLMSLAKPKLNLGTVNYGIKSYHARVSQVSWLQDRSSAVVSRISRRAHHVTGLSLNRAEHLQVANYGIGGFYAPHFDCRPDPNNRTKVLKGHRVATALFYLSDVALGGATVFLKLGLAVFPKRGAAVLWRNVLPSGDMDLRSLHAACPVLRGYKWKSFLDSIGALRKYRLWNFTPLRFQQIHTMGQVMGEFKTCSKTVTNKQIPF